jgi:hypothetical protein
MIWLFFLAYYHPLIWVDMSLPNLAFWSLS